MIRQNIQNFKLGTLRRTKVTASCGLALLMSFAGDIRLDKHLEFCFSHLKRRNRGYSVSAKILSFLQMIIKGGDRLSNIDLLRADPGLRALLRMERFPRPNTLAELSRRLRQRDIHRLAECGMRLVVRALRLRKLRRVVLYIDTMLIESEVRVAGMSLDVFSVFRPGNATPQSHNLSLVRKIHHYLHQHLPKLKILLRSDSAGYNPKLMDY